MAKRYTHEEVEKIYENMGLLLDGIFVRFHDRIECHDSDGYKFSVKPMDVQAGSQPRRFVKENPYTIYNIKHYIEINNIDCELLSETYINNNTFMDWKCKCGNVFSTIWNRVLGGKHSCRNCAREYMFILDIEEVRPYFIEKDLTLLSNECNHQRQELEFVCNKHPNVGVQFTTLRKLRHDNTGCSICGVERTTATRKVDENYMKDVTTEKGYIFVNIIYKNKGNDGGQIEYLCPNHMEIGVQRRSIQSMKKAVVGKCPYCLGQKFYAPENYHNYFINRINDINSNIDILSDNVNRYSKSVNCKCKIDGFEWATTPHRLLNGAGCVICGYEYSTIAYDERKNDFLNIINDRLPNIKIVGEYCGKKEKIKCECKICGTLWYANTQGLLSAKIGCPECMKKHVGESNKKSNEEFVSELFIANPQLKVLEEYRGMNVKIRCLCLKHNYEWNASPPHILHRNTGCPRCASYQNEIRIQNIFDGWGYEYIPQKRFSDCKYKNTLPFDLYLPEYHILIEYSGEGHYRPIRRGSMTSEDAEKQLELVRFRDNIKYTYCKNSNIPLIIVPYWERDDMEYFLFDKLAKLNAIEEIA